jgi:hypothetical protein
MTYSYNMLSRQVTAVTSENIQISTACDIPGATHVVTELKYGFNAFLLFEVESSTSYSKQEIGGYLDVIIKKIPSVEISGTANLTLTDEESVISSSLSFRFHGDTVVDPPPQSFDEAIEVYQTLPNASLSDSRVVSFSISPLSDYCDLTDAILNDISNSNVESLTSMMVDFEQVEKVLRRLKKTNLALDFSRYRLVLLDLESRFEAERSYFTSAIQTLLPNIRSGDAEDTELTALLDEYNNSLYEKERFLALLGTRQKEIETAEFIIYNENLPSTTYVDLDHTGDMASCIIGHDYAIVYELQILPESYTSLGDEYDTGTLDESDKWFMDEAEVGLNQPLMYDFIELSNKNAESGTASICFLISLTEFDDSEETFQLKLLKSGATIAEPFEAPQKIYAMDVVERGYDTMVVTVHHEAASDLALDSAYYLLIATYETIYENVRVIFGS